MNPSGYGDVELLLLLLFVSIEVFVVFGIVSAVVFVCFVVVCVWMLCFFKSIAIVIFIILVSVRVRVLVLVFVFVLVLVLFLVLVLLLGLFFDKGTPCSLALLTEADSSCVLASAGQKCFVLQLLAQQ